MLRWSQRVLYGFATIATVLGVGLAAGGGGSMAVGVAVAFCFAFGAVMAWIGWRAPSNNPVIRALVTGQPKLTRVTLFPSANLRAPAEEAASVLRRLPYSVVFALDDETVPGEYRLPRDQAADFVTQLKRLDGHVVIEASDANGERYRVTAAEDLR